jgi:serine/threonine-protein kinase
MMPRNIGRYQIKAELNKGGMSVVYLATDPRFGRDVAIKLLPRSMQDQPNVRARFEREYRIIAALEHPCIVPVYDVGEEDGQPYLVMRHMPGGSLADLLTYGRLNLPDAARITQRLASALDEAHTRGIIHRDLKPGNILFDNHGDAFLSDFGIVKLFENDTGAQAMSGSVVLGTPAYMSPEQALGKPLDPRSDVYSLGGVLYEMLTGVPPYKGPTSISVAMKHVVEPVPDPREYRPDLSPDVVNVVEKAMAKDADARYNSAGEMALALAAASAGAASAEPMMPPITVRRKPRTTSANKPAGEGIDSPSTEMPVSGSMPMAAQDQQNEGRSGRVLLVVLGVLAALTLLTAAAVWLFALTQRGQSAPPPTPTPGAIATVVTTPMPGSTPEETAQVILVPTRESPATATPTPQVTEAPAEARLRVNIANANVRSGPSTTFNVIERLASGTELIPLAVTENETGRWYLVTLPNGQRGWISSTVVDPVIGTAIEQVPTVIVQIPPTATSQPTVTPTLTEVPTLAPTATSTPTNTPTPTTTTIPTPVPLPTSPPTPTPTTTPMVTPTYTLTPTYTPTPTETPLPTPAP